MNREIKFRAWYGGAGYGDIKPHMLYDERPGDSLVWVNQGQDIKAVMQYTGLKDKNGKEIYEGDVVRFISIPMFDEDEKTCEETVAFDEGCFWTKGVERGKETKTPLYVMLDDSIFKDIEVIGNIYEHPHLLHPKDASGPTE